MNKIHFSMFHMIFAWILMAPVSVVAKSTDRVQCIFRDELTGPDGQETVTNQAAVLDSENPFHSFEGGIWQDLHVVGDVYLNSDSGLEITLGDYCGEHYHHIKITSIGTGIQDEFSYGRNEHGYWKRLVLECAPMAH
jgi:hypothetical protein